MTTKQLSLFDSPHRPVVPRDPNVAPEARPRLSRKAMIILDMLRKGRQSGQYLAKVTHRFGGRIYDLRRAGCVIAMDGNPRTGESWYELTYEPEGLP